LISPEGKVILKHHKVVVSRIVESGDTAPGDAYDWFVEKFGDGPDAFFPVADTELGKIGFLICAEGHYAEISRGLALNGAEIILRPNATSDPHMTEPQDIMTVVSRFNAFTNMCYLVESNWSYYRGTGGFPYGAGAGGSQIVDYKGRILAKVYGPAETGVASEVNMQSLRRYRKESAFASRMVYIPTQIFRKVYETDLWPLNTLMEKEGSMTTAEWDQLRREVIERRSDIYAPPENK
jgi:predicted amidohydrolase